MNQDINAARRKFGDHFKQLRPNEEWLPEIGPYLRKDWSKWTEQRRATASTSILHYNSIKERNKIRFRNNWTRFRSYLAWMPELQTIANDQNHPLHDLIDESAIDVSEDSVNKIKMIYEFQDLVVQLINFFESDNKLHVSKNTDRSLFLIMTDHLLTDQ